MVRPVTDEQFIAAGAVVNTLMQAGIPAAIADNYTVCYERDGKEVTRVSITWLDKKGVPTITCVEYEDLTTEHIDVLVSTITEGYKK